MVSSEHVGQTSGGRRDIEVLKVELIRMTQFVCYMNSVRCYCFSLKMSLIRKNLSFESTNWEICHYYPCKFPTDFPDPTLTLAVTPDSRGVGTPQAALPVHDPGPPTMLRRSTTAYRIHEISGTAHDMVHGPSLDKYTKSQMNL